MLSSASSLIVLQTSSRLARPARSRAMTRSSTRWRRRRSRRINAASLSPFSSPTPCRAASISARVNGSGSAISEANSGRAANRCAAYRESETSRIKSDIWGLECTLQPSVSVHSTMKQVGRAVEFLAWTAFFVVAASVLAVRFWVLPDIERYRGEIVAAVSAAVGQPVRIGGIQAGWYGLNPQVQLRDVRIYDHAGREALTLPSIENRLAWSSLLRGELKVRSLAIDGLRLQIRRDAEGALYVAGVKLGSDARFSRWLLAQDEVVLRNAEIEWHDERRGAPALALTDVNIRLRNSGEQHSLGFSARPPEELASSVELRAVLQGPNLSDPAAWEGRVYVELGASDLAAWRTWIDHPWRIVRGDGAVRAWLT